VSWADKIVPKCTALGRGRGKNLLISKCIFKGL
jgi:hypothetical protein